MILNRAVFLAYLTLLLGISNAFSQETYVDSLRKSLTVDQPVDTNRVNALNNLARSLYRSEPLEAMQYAKEAIETSRKLHFKKGEAHGYRYLSSQYFVRGQQDSARFFIDKALKIYEEIQDSRGIAISKGTIGTIYAVTKDFENATRTFLEACSAYEAMEEYAPAAIMYNNIGNIYLEHELFDKAIEHYQKSLKTYEKTDQRRQISMPYSGLATAYLHLQEYEKAMEYVETGMELAKQNNLLSNLGYLLETGGDIQLTLGNEDEALEYLSNALDIFNKFGNLNKISDLGFSMASLEYKSNDYQSARQNLLSVTKTLSDNELGMTSLEAEAYELLAKTEVALGNPEDAIEYLFLSKEISDSLYKQESAVKISELETIYETRKKEDQIKLLQYENEVAKLRIGIVIVFALTIIIIILASFWLILKQRAERKRMELKSIQRELEQYGILLSEKNSFLGLIIERLENMVGDIKTVDSRKDMHSVIQSIRQNINISESEDRLFNKIEQVNAGFFLALKRKVGDLSASEKKLASLVQMDISKKDIANILNINPKSVNQAKYRLKKKIGLDAELDLKEYLNSMV